MSITFDHVEGVVQKANEPGEAPRPGGEAAPAPKPPAETFEESRRRMERLARRLHAD